MSTVLGNYVTPVPAQQRLGPRWYTGSADAILQSSNLIYDDRPDYIVVFGADHVYRMDPRQMVEQHIASGAAATVAGIRVPRSEASQFGVIDADRDGKVISFLEKPKDPPGLPDNPDETFASMGNYVFTTKDLMAALRADSEDDGSVHDMGGSIMPYMVDKGDAYVYDFANNDVPGSTDRDRGYWRDVGTLDAYYDAHMDLVAVHPIFNLYNDKWAIYSNQPQLPPGQVRRGRTGPGIDGGLGRHRGRFDRAALGPVAQGQRRRRRLHRGFGAAGRGPDRGRRRRAQSHPGQGRRRAARCEHRRGSGARPPALPRHPVGCRRASARRPSPRSDRTGGRRSSAPSGANREVIMAGAPVDVPRLAQIRGYGRATAGRSGLPRAPKG